MRHQIGRKTEQDRMKMLAIVLMGTSKNRHSGGSRNP